MAVLDLECVVAPVGVARKAPSPADAVPPPMISRRAPVQEGPLRRLITVYSTLPVELRHAEVHHYGAFCSSRQISHRRSSSRS